MSELDRPIPESYWVEPGRFLAGEYPAAVYAGRARERLNNLLESGINTFIDLTFPNELPSYLSLLQEQASLLNIEVQYNRFSILDRNVPIRRIMTGILNAIDNTLVNGRNVYLHCWGGIGRTGTTVGCYLVRHGLTGQQALAQLATWWQEVPKSAYYHRCPETDQQVDFILNWDES
jgi:hypothetical protein